MRPSAQLLFFFFHITGSLRILGWLLLKSLNGQSAIVESKFSGVMVWGYPDLQPLSGFFSLFLFLVLFTMTSLSSVADGASAGYSPP